MDRWRKGARLAAGNGKGPLGGFTLLEVLVAMVILSITFVWLLKAENQGLDMALRSKFITISTILAQRHIAQVKMDPSSLPDVDNSGDFGDEFKGYTYEEHVEATPIADYNKYTLVVRLGDGKNGFENTFITFFASE